jgi:hypothetical protein
MIRRYDNEKEWIEYQEGQWNEHLMGRALWDDQEKDGLASEPCVHLFGPEYFIPARNVPVSFSPPSP